MTETMSIRMDRENFEFIFNQLISFNETES